MLIHEDQAYQPGFRDTSKHRQNLKYGKDLPEQLRSVLKSAIVPAPFLMAGLKKTGITPVTVYSRKGKNNVRTKL